MPLKMLVSQAPFSIKRFLSLFISSSVLIFVLASCATERGPSGEFQVRPAVGEHSVVAIRVKPYTSNINIDDPVAGAGKGALTGAGAAAGAWGVELAGASDPYEAIVYVALLPVVVVTGAITGAITAHPETEVIKATTAIKAALSDTKPAEGIQDALVKSLTSLYGDRVRTQFLSGYEMNMSPDQLAALGIDTVLDLEISHLDLVVSGKLDPDAALTMTIRASVIVTDTKAATPPSSWTYLGKRHDYFDLAEDDAHLLRESIKNTYKEIANVLVTDYF